MTNLDSVKKYIKTKKGLISKIYNSQKQNSNRRGNIQPNYSLKELRKFLFKNDAFNLLYTNWVDNNYKKDFIPSCDRLNDDYPYTLKNIIITTWKENNDKYSSDLKLGINNKILKSINQFNKTNLIKEYHSIAEATRCTGVNSDSISAVCNNKRTLAGGYIWKFKK